MDDCLNSNLKLLEVSHPELAAQVRDHSPHPGFQWIESKDPARPSAQVTQTTEQGEVTLTLASKFNPLKEAEKAARDLDLQGKGIFIVHGMALGYHIQAIHEKITPHHVLIVYEPDLSLMRAVLERLDCSSWLKHPLLMVYAGQVSNAQIVTGMERILAQVSLGMQLIHHAPSRKLFPENIKSFEEKINSFARYARTNVMTTFAHAGKTVDNLLQNMAHYAGGVSSAVVENKAKGFPAICVSAGPSLAKNVHLLLDPEIRPNIVLICVQTMLKPLLHLGIRPNFVTALDYHHISARFYEDIGDISDITLFAEPKCNSAILDAYPGPTFLINNDVLDRVLKDQKRPMAEIRPGSTVAHLSFYLAQYLGCDPIAFIGQDLGFSDGLYYVPGTSIHEVWAPELNEFNTLEMMEWRRIVRHRRLLAMTEDHDGHPIYTDEQMITYQRQFERDFKEAPQRIIDATEGGTVKEFSERMSLQSFLKQFATRPVPQIPRPKLGLDLKRLQHARQRLQYLDDQTYELSQLTVRTTNNLKRMQKLLHDQRKLKKLFDEVEQARHDSAQYDEALSMARDINQIGTFRRWRHDRDIRIQEGLSEAEIQKRKLARDVENMDWTKESCSMMRELYASALKRMDQAIAKETENRHA